MTIRILPEPDVTVTASELERYKAEYRQSYMYYSGTPPTLNEFIYQRQQEEKARSQ